MRGLFPVAYVRPIVASRFVRCAPSRALLRSFVCYVGCSVHVRPLCFVRVFRSRSKARALFDFVASRERHLPFIKVIAISNPFVVSSILSLPCASV